MDYLLDGKDIPTADTSELFIRSYELEEAIRELDNKKQFLINYLNKVDEELTRRVDDECSRKLFR